MKTYIKNTSKQATKIKCTSKMTKQIDPLEVAQALGAEQITSTKQVNLNDTEDNNWIDKIRKSIIYYYHYFSRHYDRKL